MKKKKTPNHNKSLNISKQKQPKRERDIILPPKFEGRIISWRFNATDKGGVFSWCKLDCPKKHKEVIQRLSSFETFDQNALENAGCHFIETEKLSIKAQTRLSEIYLDDLDRIYSFRITGQQRVFCVYRQFKQYCYIRVLWWDPEHKVCPSIKKHT